MAVREHARTAGTALKNWFIAQLLDSLCVAAIWLVGLLIVLRGHVLASMALAVLAFVFQMIPHFGPVITLVVMALAGIIKGGFEHWEPMVYMFILYAIIVVLDGLVLQPMFMRRRAKIPIWASIVTPLVLGFVLPLWGVLLAPPLLAIFFAFRDKSREQQVEIIPPDNLPERRQRTL
jgi:predicted PurR-regulated permease PerM